MLKDEIKSEIKSRKEEYRDYLRFEQAETIEERDGYSIQKRADWVGLSKGVKMVLPTIYDSLCLICLRNVLYVVAKINGLSQILKIENTEVSLVSDEVFRTDDEYSTFTGIVVASPVENEREEGLFCPIKDCFIFETKYKCVSANCSVAGVWAMRSEGGIIYKHMNENNEFFLSDALIPLEHPKHILYINTNHRVVLVNEDGIPDMLGLRKLVKESGGRLKLGNSRSHKSYICDSTGYILNY